MEFSVYFILLVGIVLRLMLFDTDVSQWLTQRNEISTPLTSWLRLIEGLKLLRTGISPYDGDVYHEMPLVLAFWNEADRLLGSACKYLFVAMDVAVAILLYSMSTSYATYYLNKQAKESNCYHPSSKKMILNTDYLKSSRIYVLSAFMLNPLAVASCVAKSTGLLNNLFIVLSLFSAIRGNRFGVSIFTGISTYLSLYPFVLIIPFALLLAQKDAGKQKEFYITSCLQTIICFSTFLVMLMYASYSLEGNWNFLRSTLGFVLGAPDHSPNIGIFWYFFTELFDHFKVFFLCVFQIHVCLYVFPLSCRLKEEPFFAAFISLAFISIFKSYPGYGDTTIWGPMVFLWYHSFNYMRNSFTSVVALVAAVALGPVFWHLWLFAGSANANFYFASSLILTSAQVFIVFDVLFAYLKRSFELKVGTNQLDSEGKPVRYLLD